MLSYRHAFHAGNHADVLKHLVFSEVLKYFNQKDKPYWVIDTHAGAGLYALQDEYAQQNGEFVEGIARLFAADELTPALADYVALVQSFNTTEALDYYPGSPSIAHYHARTNEKLRLFELHSQDIELLQDNFSRHKKQVKIQQLDGFQGLKSCLPPTTKRAVVLIDPPYELKTDYEAVVKSIQDSLKRFATGTYLVWYPLLPREEPKNMLENLLSLNLPNWLNVTLSVQMPSPDFGMYGSGMFIINPPWLLPKVLEENIPVLKRLLAVDGTANYTIDSQIT